MCGIIGFVAKNNKSPKKLLRANFPAISSRGTVMSTYDEPDASYGYSRLVTDNTTDSSLNQIAMRDDHLFLYNGILNNTSYLNQEFNLPNSCQTSDTLTLDSGFSSHGIKFLEQCRGMFAFTHITTETITLVRDTIGIKPLYYLNSEQVFGFSSEIKGLTQETHSPIKEVLPGEIITYNRDTGELHSDKFTYKSTAPYFKTDIQKILRESCVIPTQRYLQDTPKTSIGLLLSGGLDSSIILQTLLRELSPEDCKRLIIFSIGYPDSQDVQVSKQLTADLSMSLIHILPYDAGKSLDVLSEIVHITESPHPRVTKIGLLQHALASAIREKNIQVIITGEGADELFYGYERFIEQLTSEDIDYLFTTFFNEIFPRTLLQRLDRVFSHHQIEARVPFLDQELIGLAKTMTVQEKVGSHHSYKLPLRSLAKDIGLPEYIWRRKKLKMGQGATNQPNTSNPEGYLEAHTESTLNQSFSELVHAHYRTHYFKDDRDVLTESYNLITEIDLQNYINQKRTHE